MVVKEDKAGGRYNKMKHYWLITVFGIFILCITGCYTQLATNNDDDEVYYEPIVVPDPDPVPPPPRPGPGCPAPKPPPIPDPSPPYDPPEQPTKERVYKYRNPESDRPSDSKDREPIRNTGGRNNYGGRGR